MSKIAPYHKRKRSKRSRSNDRIRVYLARDAVYHPGAQFHSLALPVKASELVVQVLRFGVRGY